MQLNAVPTMAAIQPAWTTTSTQGCTLELHGALHLLLSSIKLRSTFVQFVLLALQLLCFPLRPCGRRLWRWLQFGGCCRILDITYRNHQNTWHYMLNQYLASQKMCYTNRKQLGDLSCNVSHWKQHKTGHFRYVLLCLSLMSYWRN